LSKSILSNILFENPVPLNMHLQMQPRSANVEKMSGIITKRICQMQIARWFGNPKCNPFAMISLPTVVNLYQSRGHRCTSKNYGIFFINRNNVPNTDCVA